MPRSTRVAAAALCAALLLGAAAAAAAPRQTERSRQKAAAELSRAGIEQKLATLKRDIGRTESAREDAADTLAASEEAISNANRSLRDLAAEQGETNARVRELGEARDKLQKTVDAQKIALARLLREHYVAGNEDRIKLLLSGDNPNRIERDLQLMSYVSQAQARLLGALRANLAAVEANQVEASNARDELEEIAQEEREQKAVLEQEKGRRAALLGSLSQRLAAQRKEVGKMEADQRRMDGLVNKLALLIKQEAEAQAVRQREEAQAQARAAAEAQAKAQAQAQARAKAQAERERLAREAARTPPGPGLKPLPSKPTPFKPDPIDADEPALAQKPPEPKPRAPDITLAPAALDGAFASLRGQLRAPVAGRLAIKFGSKLGEGRWKGVFVKTDEGSDVRVVAAGRVIFADWVRGLGNVIIVDHGSGYWSVYGYNQSLLRRAGDAVKGGEPVASSGKSGGQEESGLYFEMRHNTVPFDPASWVKF